MTQVSQDPRLHLNHRYVLISDIHEQQAQLVIPKCDYLIVSGDITFRGDLFRVQEFSRWVDHLKDVRIVRKEVIVIAGNHDLTAQRNPPAFRAHLSANLVYLEDSSYLTEDGVHIYGAPWSPSFHRENGWVFNADRGKEIQDHWSKIPYDVDILVVHGPPYGARDMVANGEHVGCKDLRRWIETHKPRLVVCGHIHEDYGLAMIGTTLVANASSLDLRYKPVNPPLVIDL